MVVQLTALEVSEKLQREPGTVVLLDVREPFERALAVIEPSMHIPLGEVPERAAEIPKDREVIVYCHTGSRSMMVAGFLSTRGWKTLANLAGGIDAWSVQVDPNVPRYH